MKNRPTILLALLWTGAALAQPPPIREIVFEGNATTQPETMLREMLVRPGDPADPASIERSRQAVQDLGLFRSVSAEQQPLADGVRLAIRVQERYYLVPSPRLDYNSDGQFSYGAQLRWNNVLGRNHVVRGTVKYRNRQEAGRGTALVVSGGYSAPLLWNSPYSLDLSGSRAAEPVDAATPYDEIDTTLRFALSRSFRGTGPSSQGFSAGLGAQWRSLATDGLDAPPPRGQTLALLLNGGYGLMHNWLYSETGQRVGAEVQSAGRAFGSSLAFTSLSGSYDGAWRLPGAAHQTFGLFARLGSYHGATLGGTPPFELGGADSLRGYRRQVLRGDDFYYGGVEFLRPLGWDWLRGMAFVEAGDISGGNRSGAPYADAGIGVRLRLTWFVNLELSAGLAWPLTDGGDGRGPRIFAGGYR